MTNNADVFIANNDDIGTHVTAARTNCFNFIVPEFNPADPAVASAPQSLSDIEVAAKAVARVANVQQARRLEVLQRLEDDRWVLERFLGAGEHTPFQSPPSLQSPHIIHLLNDSIPIPALIYQYPYFSPTLPAIITASVTDPDLARDIRFGIEEHQRRLYESQGEELLLAYRQRRMELGFDVEEIPEEIEAEFQFRSKYKQFVLKKYRPKRTPMSLQNKWKRLLPRGKEQRKEEEEERRLWRIRKTQLQQLLNGNSKINQFRIHLAQRNAPIDAQLVQEEEQRYDEEATGAVEGDEMQHRRELRRIRQSLMEDDDCSGVVGDEDDDGYDEEASEPDEVGMPYFDEEYTEEEKGGKDRGLLHDGDGEEDWKRSMSSAPADSGDALAREIAALARLMDAEEAGGRADIMGEVDDAACTNKPRSEKNPLFSYPALKDNIRRAMALYMQKVAVTPMTVTLDGDLITIPTTTPLDVKTAATSDGLLVSRQLSTRVGGVMPSHGVSLIRNASPGNPSPLNALDVISQTTAHRLSQAVVPGRTCHRVDPLVSKNKKPLFFKEAPPVGVLDALAKIKLYPCIPLLTNSQVVTHTRGVLWGNEWTEKVSAVVSDMEERRDPTDVVTTAVPVHVLPEDDGYGHGVKIGEEPFEPSTIEPETTITVVSDQTDAVFSSLPLSLSERGKREQESQGETAAIPLSGLYSAASQPLPLGVNNDDDDNGEDVLEESFDDSDHEAGGGGRSPPSPHHSYATHHELRDSCSEAGINNHHPANNARPTNSTASLPSFPSSPRHGVPPAASRPTRRVSFQSNVAPVPATDQYHQTSSSYGQSLSSHPFPPVISKPSKIPYQRDRDVSNRDGAWAREEAKGKGNRLGVRTEGRYGGNEGNQEPTAHTASVAPRNFRRKEFRSDAATARDVGGARHAAGGQREVSKQMGDTSAKSGEEVRAGVTFQVPDKVPKGLYLIPQTTTTAPTGRSRPLSHRPPLDGLVISPCCCCSLGRIVNSLNFSVATSSHTIRCLLSQAAAHTHEAPGSYPLTLIRPRPVPPAIILPRQ